MPMLSDDDLNLRELTDDEVDGVWDLWFDLAQTTHEWDPAYSHGVLAGLEEPVPALRDASPPTESLEDQGHDP